MITYNDIAALQSVLRRWPQTAETMAWAARFTDDLLDLIPEEDRPAQKAPESPAIPDPGGAT